MRAIVRGLWTSDRIAFHDRDCRATMGINAEPLTDRELEVFRLIGDGVSTSAIAGQLFLSTHTVDTHRENIKTKLGAKTGADLNRKAIQSMLENG